MKKEAVISNCGKYRYQLSREWDDTKPKCLFIMLNPSTADADIDDPTITRCIGFAKSWGFGGLMVGNLFAYRSTDPRNLKESPEMSPTADWLNAINERHLHEMWSKCDMAIFAWGTFKGAINRGAYISNKFRGAKAITISKCGFPCHPLYLKQSLTPIPFN